MRNVLKAFVMEPLDRFPNCTSCNNDNPEAELILLQLDHAMRRKYDDPGLDLIRYGPYDEDKMEILALHPFAVVEESMAIEFWEGYMTSRAYLPDIIEIVDPHIRRILKRIRWSRKRDRLLGRNSDPEGNVITDARLWKYDPVYREFAGLLGFDCSDPILLGPSVYDFNNGVEQMTACRRRKGVSMQGELVDGDGLAMTFRFEDGPLQEVTLNENYTCISLSGLVPPEAMAMNFVGRPLSAIVSSASLPESLLDRRVSKTEMEAGVFKVYLAAPGLVGLDLP